MITQTQAYGPDDASQQVSLELLKDARGPYGVGLVGDNISENDRSVRIVYRPDKVIVYPESAPAFLHAVPRHLVKKFSIETLISDTLHRSLLKRDGWDKTAQLMGCADIPEQLQRKFLRHYHGCKAYAERVTNGLVNQALQVADQDALGLARRFHRLGRLSMYQYFVTDGIRARQLAETFPFLAQCIYTGRFCTAEDVEKATEARALVKKGAELKRVAAAADIPMHYRKFKPGTVDIVNGVLLDKPHLVHAFLPDTLPKMRRWVNAVQYAERELSGPFTEWVARHAVDLGSTKDQAKATLLNLSDWVQASYASMVPPHCANALLGRYRLGVNEGPQSGHQDLVTRPFDASMSFETVLQLSDEWHEAVSQAEFDGKQIEFPEPWYPGGKAGEHKIVPLRTWEALYQEGRQMHHCVASYRSQVVAGETYVYSIVKGGEKVATMSLIRGCTSADPRTAIPSIGQIAGRQNAIPPKKIERAARRWVQRNRKQLGTGNMPAEQIAPRPAAPEWDGMPF
jgi:hypothetical protein